jgi:hypothetical protein
MTEAEVRYFVKLMNKEGSIDELIFFSKDIDHETFFKFIFYINDQYDGLNDKKRFKQILDILYNLNRGCYNYVLIHMFECKLYKQFIDEYTKPDSKYIILNTITDKIKKEMNNKKYLENGSLLAKHIPNEGSTRNIELGNIYVDIVKRLGISRVEFRKNYLVPYRKAAGFYKSYLNDNITNVKLKNISKYNINSGINSFLMCVEDGKYLNMSKKLQLNNGISRNMELYYFCEKLVKNHRKGVKLNTEKIFERAKKIVDSYWDKYYNTNSHTESKFNLINYIENGDNDSLILMILFINIFKGDKLMNIPVIENNKIIKFEQLSDIDLNIDILFNILGRKINYSTELLDTNSQNLIILENKAIYRKIYMGKKIGKYVVWDLKKGRFIWEDYGNNLEIKGLSLFGLCLLATSGELNIKNFIYNINNSQKYNMILY